ncbi:hypothetical protein GF108_03565 [Phyllobacterium sp. SYP-B3895]|uniref:SDH family Clp fold serine proteinase n=1 Tax=Phyllobacterium sp. SYP-B3895 TaxID=2663240 RepID=UPI0012995AE4|nr:hypothetical protein [Phyllobacterium sp. SYP-B3895]MRG54657.1 hypothetical protein [Phyllobacterium sp. SYP-B3895]
MNNYIYNSTIYFNGPISHDSIHAFKRMIDHNITSDECTMVLVTEGGDYNAAFHLAKFLRAHFDRIRIVLPSVCKGPGMLIAAVADELVFDVYGELGPVSTASQAVTGKNEMLTKYLTQLDVNFRPGAIDRLVSGYCTEQYAIDQDEARELVFAIEELTSEDRQAIFLLGDPSVVPVQGEAVIRVLAPEDVNKASDGVHVENISNEDDDAVPPGLRHVQIIHFGK